MTQTTEHSSTPLHHQKLGSGGSTIVFINGFRMEFETWNKVYPAFTADNCVILFNRRGTGKSARATEAQDGNTAVADMRSLFSELDLTPPYLIVAHSMGGLFANLYALIRST